MNDFDVWTYNDDDAWIGKNIVPDMRLVYSVNEHRARTAAELLAKRFPEATFEVRTVQGDTIEQYGSPRDRVEQITRQRPARRALGNRGA